MRVVIIEDEEDVALIQMRILEPYVRAVTVMADRFERAFLPETWDDTGAAVIDLMLPGFDGRDICQYLIENKPLVRRVICTAKPVYELAALRDMAHVILRKPFGERDLIHAVVGPDAV